MNDAPPPHDPVYWAETTAKAVACDHSFGEDGTSDHCVKCSIDRDTCERIGKAHHRREAHKRVLALTPTAADEEP